MEGMILLVALRYIPRVLRLLLAPLEQYVPLDTLGERDGPLPVIRLLERAAVVGKAEVLKVLVVGDCLFAALYLK